MERSRHGPGAAPAGTRGADARRADGRAARAASAPRGQPRAHEVQGHARRRGRLRRRQVPRRGRRPRRQSARRRHGSRHALDHRHAPRLQVEDRGRHRADRLGGGWAVRGNGASGSFHVDTISNFRSSGTSGSLDLSVVLTSSAPVYGQTISKYSFSDSYSLNPLAAGYQYSNVNSGTVGIYGASIPVGQYWQLLYLREYSGGTWYYADWIVMGKVSCNGAGCSSVASCTEDAYTMCLIGGRYRVTSHWRNQYAGGATANLSKAKLTDATGAFWIADASTYEYLIRFNTATNNGRAWIAIPTFTDVEFWVGVTDTVNGQTKEYHSNPGNQTLI